MANSGARTLSRPVVLVACLAFSMLATCGGGDSPAESLRAYLDAHNSHNVEAELARYADEVILEIPRQTTILPKADLVDRIEWDATLGSHLAMSEITEGEDRVTIGRVVESNEWLRLLGIGEILYEPGSVMVFSDGLISEIHPTPLKIESQQAIASAMERFMAWAVEARPEDLDLIVSGQQLIYSRAAAEKWIELLTEWAGEKQ